MSEVFTLNPEATEHKRDSELGGKRVELQYGASTVIGQDDEKWFLRDGSEAALAAVISTSSAKDPENADMLMVIDLSRVPIENGARSFMGQAISPNVEALLISEDAFKTQMKRGYKGLRPNSSYIYGRGVKDDRFAEQSLQTSRNHFEISYDEQGRLTVKDLDSLNGTVVMTGETGVNFVNDYLVSNKEDIPYWLVNEANIPDDETIDRAEIITEGQARVMSEAELSDIKRDLKTYDSRDENHRLADVTFEIARYYPEFSPIVGIELEGQKFAFGPIFSDTSNRLHSVAYTPDLEHPGHYRSRLFYRSNSDGGWRVTPAIYDKGYNAGIFSKGDPKEERGGEYVWLTKPDRRIVDLLEHLETTTGDILEKQYTHQTISELFAMNRMNQEDMNHFDDETRPVYIDGGSHIYDSYFPGKGYLKLAEQARFNLANMKLPKGFEPDFTTGPAYSYTTRHTIGGRMAVEVFNASYNERPIEWHVATDENGSVWIDRILLKDSQLTDYGTPGEVIAAGALATKPYEYRSAQQDLEPGIDYVDNLSPPYNHSYITMSPVIRTMPWYQHYVAARS